ncbi:MAG: naringenin-chalcone synthase [Chlamydiales bacterium]|nr:naringenin-chalcone synthase [Chlamydiales bacterium]
MSFYLGRFHLIRPPHEFSQQEILEWIAHEHASAQAKSGEELGFYEEIRERLMRVGMGSDKIQRRGTLLKEVTSLDSVREIYDQSESAVGAGLQKRMSFFETAVNQLFEEFYPEGCIAPSHLIHVTCTGYASPSGAQHIVSKRGFGAETVVTHAYHMGCYASIPALRMATGMRSIVDLVHTELCTLHMNPLLHETEQLVVQSLFADGFIKYSVSQEPDIYKILGLHEEILPETCDLMSWRLEDWGMRMTIAKEVPVVLSRALPSFIERLQKRSNWSGRSESPLLFAIHPGGPKIIDQIQKMLKLSDEQVYHSKEVLKTMGNMSSATLPHVWEKIACDENVKPGSAVLSLAFGPGLTACGAIFEKGAPHV